MITIQDAARLAEVSTATVSRVMNGSDKVSDKTKEKVQEAIKKLKYTPNNLGLYLRSSSTKSLLFLIQQEITLDYQFISGINNAAIELGYNVVIAMINGNAGMEAEFLRRVKNRLYDGVIFCMNPYSKKELHDIFESFPCVFAYVSAGDYIPSFSIDHEQAAYEATESLIRSGCRTIGILVAIFAAIFIRESDAFIVSRLRYLRSTDEERALAKENKENDDGEKGGFLNGVKYLFTHKQLRWIAICYGFVFAAYLITQYYETVMSYGFAGIHSAAQVKELSDEALTALLATSNAKNTQALFAFHSAALFSSFSPDLLRINSDAKNV